MAWSEVCHSVSELGYRINPKSWTGYIAYWLCRVCDVFDEDPSRAGPGLLTKAATDLLIVDGSFAYSYTISRKTVRNTRVSLTVPARARRAVERARRRERVTGPGTSTRHWMSAPAHIRDRWVDNRWRKGAW